MYEYALQICNCCCYQCFVKKKACRLFRISHKWSHTFFSFSEFRDLSGSDVVFSDMKRPASWSDAYRVTPSPVSIPVLIRLYKELSWSLWDSGWFDFFCTVFFLSTFNWQYMYTLTCDIMLCHICFGALPELQSWAWKNLILKQCFLNALWGNSALRLLPNPVLEWRKCWNLTLWVQIGTPWLSCEAGKHQEVFSGGKGGCQVCSEVWIWRSCFTDG